jgi:hypothetical protein
MDRMNQDRITCLEHTLPDNFINFIVKDQPIDFFAWG